MSEPVQEAPPAVVSRSVRARRPSGTWRPWRRKPLVETVLLCVGEDGTIEGLRVQSRGKTWTRQSVRLTSAQDASALIRRIGLRASWMAVLPRTDYLVKAVEIPCVQPEEIRGLLRLEAEAMLPSDFGPLEVSHRLLPSGNDGRLRCELYIARADAVARLAEQLSQQGIHLEAIVPSALVWSAVLEAEDSARLAVAFRQWCGRAEVAFCGQDGSLSVRSVNTDHTAASSLDGQEVIAACVRSLLGRQDSLRGATLQWFGPDAPASFCDGAVSVRCGDGIGDGKEDGDGRTDPLVEVAAVAITKDGWPDLASAASLLPWRLHVDRRRRQVRRRLAVGGACLILGLSLAGLAFEVSARRYDRVRGNLAARTALIRTEGAVIGRHIQQLEAVRAARATRDDFLSVVNALHDGTTGGASYSAVTLSEGDVLRLEGQAESLSAAFLLPQRLSQQPAFERMSMRDSSLQSEGGGAAAKFRIDGHLRRAH